MAQWIKGLATKPDNLVQSSAPHDGREEPIPANCLLASICSSPYTMLNKYSDLLKHRSTWSKRLRPSTVPEPNA